MNRKQNDPSVRIEICGGVASGKTTLCNLLAEKGLRSVLERFSDNPFWSLFYENPGLYAFEAEVTFLLQHYSQIKSTIIQKSAFACDFSLIQDEAYAKMNLSGGRRTAFRAIYAHVVNELPPAALIVHLRCTAQEELRRIKRRARKEEETIQLAYLDALNAAISGSVAKVCKSIPILRIDSTAHNFADDPETQQQVVEDILAARGKTDAP